MFHTDKLRVDVACKVNKMNENVKPLKKFSCGGISAAVWKNNRQRSNGDDVVMLSVTLDRRYMDKDGKWQSSGSLQTNHVPKAILVLTKAFEYMTSPEVSDEHDGGEQE